MTWITTAAMTTSYISAKRYSDAIRESEKLFAVDKNNPVLLNNLAWLYDNNSDERGLEYAEKAYKGAPKSAAVMDTLGWILVRKGKIERGTKLLETANDLVPRQGDIVYHFAAALNKSGRTKEARRHLECILKSGAGFSEMEAAKALLKELGG